MKKYDLDHNHSLNEIVSFVAEDRELAMTIADNMIKYGGSFVKALGRCFYAADHKNTMKLTEAFMSYVLDYQPKRWDKKMDSLGRGGDDEITSRREGIK